MKISDRIRNTAIVLGLGTVLLGVRVGLAADAEDQQHWSLQKVRPAPPPEVRNQQFVSSPVDSFILASLEKKGLLLSSECDKRTLIRRVTFDLTGLPPTPAEIAEFVQDPSPAAFADVVDRLLASAQYGERWGRHWLDVVRYADARDLIQLPAASDFREAWRYRDWVVASFNRDLPYDRFVMQQVAGDLMQPTDASQIDTDALVATGMLAIADFVPGDVDKQQMIADYVNDQIDVVGRAILGMTLACARCHDHKFDPITTEDYYSLAGIFFSTKLIPSPVKGNTPLVRVPLLPAGEIAALEERQKQDAIRIAELSREIGTFGDRQYRLSLAKKVASETQRYLLATWDCLQKSADQAAIDELATKSGLSNVALTRWVEYVDRKPVPPVLAAIRTETNRVDAERMIRGLTEQLSEVAESRRRLLTNDAALKALDQLLVLRLCADDQRLISNDADRIASIPNRGPFAENASPVAEVMSPTRVTMTVGERSQSVIRFSGNELLQVPRAIPSVGSLIVVFRPDPAGGGGQRLIGWEDASVGQHGLGIMTDGKGSLHVIARRDGANGDVVVAAPESLSNPSGLQIVSVNWGQDGVTVFRDGQLVGSNKAIDGLSSDPAIKALRLGGPGSGSSSRFQGDLAELRVYDAPLDDSARKHVEGELAAHWIERTDDIASLNPIEDLYGELLSGVSPFRLEAAEREQSLSEDSQTRLTELRNEVEALKKKPKPEIPQAVVVQEGGPAETPHAGFNDAHVYLRGNHANLGRRVPRGFPGRACRQ